MTRYIQGNYKTHPSWVEMSWRATWSIFYLISLIACESETQGGAHSTLTADDFIARSQRLKQGLRASPELDDLISEYEQLVSSSKDLPGVEWAMWDLARLYTSNYDSSARPVGNSLEKSIYWYRQAIEIASPESGVWIECQIGLATQLRGLNDDDELLESGKIIQNIIQRFPNDAIIQLRCQQETVAQLVSEKKLKEAEKVCRQILELEDFPVPHLLRAYRHMAVDSLLMQGVRQFDNGTVSDEWLQSFLDDYPGDSQVESCVERARERLARIKRSTADPAIGLPVDERHQNSGHSRVILFVNICILGLIGAVILYRRLMS